MKFFTNSNESGAELGVAERTAFGFGNFSNAFLFIAISAFLTYYYTTVIGLNAGVIGSIMLVSRVFDGITDLAMGYIVDHTKAKFGRARIWILRACVPYAIGGIILFMVPTGATTVIQYVFVFVSYNVVNAILYTAITVPYNTLNIVMTTNSYERGILGIFVRVFSTFGGIIVNATALKLVDFFGGDAAAWTKTIAVYSVLGLIMHFICIFGTKERVIKSEDDEKYSVGVIVELFHQYRSRQFSF